METQGVAMKPKMWVSRLFMLLSITAVVSSQRCIFPTQFSHRSITSSTWLLSRGQGVVSDEWIRGKSWSKIHRLLSSKESTRYWNVSEADKHTDEFSRWVAGITRSSSQPEKLAVAYTLVSPGKSTEAQVLSTFATEDTSDGDILLDIPAKLVLSDEWTKEDPKALRSAPWEVRLAFKLLRERSRGERSLWASYLKLLPSFVPMPLFFSDLELNNVQDLSLQNEVFELRRYIRATYQALHGAEIEGTKFSEYAWALSMVYSSACQVDKSDFTGLIHVEFENDGLKLVSHHIRRGSSVALEHSSSTLTDTFLFRGFVPRISHRDSIKVFADVLELVDWYSSARGAVNNNRYLTWRLARDLKEAHAAYVQPQDQASYQHLASSEIRFRIWASGLVDHYLISVLATLDYAKQALVDGVDGKRYKVLDFIVRNGSRNWETVLRSIVGETRHRFRWNIMDCNKSFRSSFRSAFASAKSALLERLHTILNSYSTDLAEDQILVDVSKWEGVSEDEGEQVACPSCRWQIEQMSLHDNLALHYRFSVKTLLSEMIVALSCGTVHEHHLEETSVVTHAPEPDQQSLKDFVGWCTGHDLTISEKLNITDILVPAEDEFSSTTYVRGVLVLEDIRQGETLSSLPMTVGLFNNDSLRDGTEPDAWDYAAARLLRERAKGSASMWAPYLAILPEYLPTPIHFNSQELGEVQWWPVMRELVQVRKAIKESYTKFTQNELGLASFSDYKWAVTMVHSRAFTLPVRANEQYEHYVLMPFMDMINHHYRYQADWTSQPVWDGKLEITAKRTIKKGGELFASFGPRTNDNLFLYYGFVLKDNAFDTVTLFENFEEAARWYKRVWTRDCVEFSDNEHKSSQCHRKTWDLLWQRVKPAVEVAEVGSRLQGNGWGELVNSWADLGFQFLPYQPGPTLYAGGIVDPSFLAVLSSCYEALESLQYENKVVGSLCPQCTNNSTPVSSAMRMLFKCLDGESQPLHGLLVGDFCAPEIHTIFIQLGNLTPSVVAARISVALRCKEILASFPTSLDEDRELLRSSSNSRRVSSLLQLTWRYRYMKKLLLQTAIDKLLD